MHQKNAWNHFVVPGIVASIALGACTYDAPTGGQPSGAGGTNQSSSSSSSSSSSGMGGAAGQTSSSSSGDPGPASSSTSSGDAGSTSSSTSSSSGSGSDVFGVNCEGFTCVQQGQPCCDANGTLTCMDLMLCQGATIFFCDGKEDCNGAPCCFDGKVGNCMPDCTGGKTLCNDDSDCFGGTCDTTAHGTIGECGGI